MMPTEYMYRNYSKFHPEIKDAWEIFAEVAREIVARSGNFIKSDLNTRISYEYESHLLESFPEKLKKIQCGKSI